MYTVIFYKTTSGNDVVLSEIRHMSVEDRAVIGRDLRRVQMGFPLGMPLCRSLGGGLWEVRSSLPSKREFRLIFFVRQGKLVLVVLSAFVKKSTKTPDIELKIARKRMSEITGGDSDG
jgi:phage-related protein